MDPPSDHTEPTFEPPSPALPPGVTGEGPAQAETAPAAPPPAAPGSLERLWREWIRPLLVVLVVMLSFRSALADWNDVPSGSMKPTIIEGDRIFVNKAAYGLRLPFTRVRLLEWSEPERGDIVVLFSPDDGKRLVKRVVGVPGDRLELRRGRLLLNGEPLRYAPVDLASLDDLTAGEGVGYQLQWEELGEGHPVMLQRRSSPRDFYGPVMVPDEHFVVMGDNRSNSRDSRAFGFVERSRIVGKATAVLLSMDKEHFPRFRSDRFFHRLE